MQEAQIYNNVVWFPLLFLSGATFPLPMLPHWVQRVATFLPATYLVDTFQGIMSDRQALAAHRSELLVLIISGIFGMLFAWKLFRWEKDEPIPRPRQLVVAGFVIPFIIMGVWMNSRTNFSASWSATFNMASARPGRGVAVRSVRRGSRDAVARERLASAADPAHLGSGLGSDFDTGTAASQLVPAGRPPMIRFSAASRWRKLRW